MWLSPAIRVFLGLEIKSHPGSEVRSFLSYWNPSSSSSSDEEEEEEAEGNSSEKKRSTWQDRVSPIVVFPSSSWHLFLL
jgi:hypothetical protein